MVIGFIGSCHPVDTAVCVSSNLQIESLGSQVRTASIGGTVTSSPQAHSRTFDSPTRGANGVATKTSPNGTAAAPQRTQKAATTTTQRSGWVSIMGPQKRNPYEDLEFPPVGFKGLSLQKTFKVIGASEDGCKLDGRE